MKRTWMIGGAAALALAATQSAAFGQAATAPRAAAPVETLAQDYVAQNRTQGIVVAYGVGDSAPVFASAGRIAVEADAAAAGPDSLWRVYSMTKPITAMAAMMLVEDGKLKLDQPIADFFPGFRTMKVLTDPANSLDSRPATTQITVRHLLTHTAGLGYSIITKGPLLKEYERLGITPGAVNAALEAQARPLRPKSLKEFAERVSTLPLIAEPGTKWSYSISLDLLPAIIEAAAGMPYEQFLQTRMLGPLKMTSTYWTVPQSEVGRFATNYAWAGENRIPFDPAKSSAWLTPPSFPYGGAGLVMSARDYDRFLHMLANGGTLDGARVMKPETVRLAMSNLLPASVTYGGAPSGSGGATGPKMGYGAGGSVQLEDVPGGAGKGTYGWGGAAGTVAWVDPSKKIRGTVMVNYFPSDKWPLRADAVKAVYAQAAR
ncbi:MULTISPECIES: serine hydrolase domain-containing protein [unclassified Sphingomonas]|uniref:serine hydrolase domain-containing protein n=1 Tax=unclassified Sphingomonas TaxID=196159 RepID=UPI00082C3949|nr:MULTISPECIES: serine hydrolase domain-containing protein [unclassified Sphingomonas]